MSESHIEGIALLALDMQAGFLRVADPDGSTTQRCRFAITAARRLGIPVLFTEQSPEKLGETLPELRQVAPEAPRFPKTSFSAFGAEGLPEWLADHQTKQILLCGIETAICVYQTSLAARHRDFGVTLLTDAVSGRRPEDGKRVLEFLQARTEVVLLPSETVFYSILGNAGHEAFRDFTRLVKESTSRTEGKTI